VIEEIGCSSNKVLELKMNESVVLYESSEYVSVSGRKVNDFYNDMRLGISEIVGELDEMWANVKHVEPQNEKRHVFRLKPFEEFISEETRKRTPKVEEPITVKTKRTPGPHITPPKLSVAPRRQLNNPTPRLSQRTPLSASQNQKVENSKPSSARTPNPQPKQRKWIRVEDICVPL
jgi:hypothetical protein